MTELDPEKLNVAPGQPHSNILSETGAYLSIGAGWQFTEYRDIAVAYPSKSNRGAPLVLRTPNGLAALLPGDPELWEVGRFFMRCREDKRAA